MTTNHHTPIPTGAPANAPTFNDPLGQLDSAIDSATTTAEDASALVATLNNTVTNLVTGSSGFTQLNLATAMSLTISSGEMTVTRSRHVVDTEASATYDDLDTIHGGVGGDVLVLQSLTSTRVVVVKHGSGNIFLNGFDVHLDHPSKALTLLFDGSLWVLIGNPPARIDRVKSGVVFNHGTAYPSGTMVGVTSGTPTISGQPEGVYTQYASIASLNSRAGVQGVTLGEMRHNPAFTAYIKTGGVVTDIRSYIGLTTALYAAGDSFPSVSGSAVVFRYSTAAGDTGYRPVVSNGTTQLLGAVVAPIAINTTYKLAVWVVNGVAYFSVNDSPPVPISTNVPTATTGMLWNCDIMTLNSASKSLLIKQILLETN